MSQVQLQDWPTSLTDRGQTSCLGGNQPLRLDDPRQAWLIHSGRVELFLVGLRADGEGGSRHHLATVSAGGLLLGIDTEGPADLVLLAVPHVDTELTALSRAALEKASTEPDLAPILALALEIWVRALSWGMARWVTPRPTIGFGIGVSESLAVPNGRRCSGRQSLVWLRLASGAALYLDTQDLPNATDRLVFPLAPEAWLLATGKLDLQARSTSTALQDGDAWEGLTNLHRLLFDTAGLNLRLANVDEYNRLQARRAATEAARDHAFHELMAVTSKPRRIQIERVWGDTPLMAALRLIGREVGFEVRLPRHKSSDGPSLSDIVRTSGLRQRVVTLRDDWWRHDFGVLLAFDKQTKQPLVLLFGPGNRPRLIDPKQEVELDFKQARTRLSQDAVELMPHLPFRPLGFRQLAGFALARGQRELLIVLAMGAIGGLITLAMPITTAYLIGSVIPDHDLSLLMQIGLALAVLGGTALVVSYAGTLAYNRAEGRIGRALQAGIMDRVLRLPMSFFQDYSTGDLATRLMAVSQVQRLVSTASVNTLLSGLFGLFGFFVMFYYDLRLTLWASLLTLLYIVLSLLLTYLRLRHERSLARLTGKLSSSLLQLILGVAKIRLAASEDRAFACWARLFAQGRRYQLAAQRIGVWQATFNQSLLLMGLLLFVLLIGKPSESPNLIAIGAFSALLMAFQYFASGLSMTTTVLTRLIAVQPKLERARPLLAAVPETGDEKADPGPLSGAIEVSHLSFRYVPDGPLILKDISLEVAAGEFVALIGPSGSGKSTLLRLLMGFEQPEKGGILFDGQDLRGLDVTAVRRQMGVVIQNAEPMPMSLYDFIMGTGDGGMDDAWEAAEQVGLADDIRQMPMGMQTVILEGGGALSGGQMQRLMVARAIVNRPKMLLLDEATSALDNRAQAIVTESLDRMRVTRIIVAHRLSTVVNADRIYVLEAGRIVEAGNYDDLMTAQGPFARLAERQLV
ncbi:MAG: NHLP bacteriocin export ABC transporter permease/ATPase subunit [Gammaproteobacteria bacterium]|nr:NHLP bacteriocin export ABC transporter permease/ATPase subunit [Gammaproteobacteria bacterium]